MDKPITPESLDRLEKIAKRADRRNWTDIDMQDFNDALNPHVCLKLIVLARAELAKDPNHAE